MKNRFVSAVLSAVIVSGLVLCGTACKTIDVFEKNVSIPQQQWERSFQPVIVFNISDTTALYNIYVTLRHTHAYNYNNIWLNVNYQLPGDTLKQQRVDIPLADNNKGWLGTGMDDIYEVRRLITPQPYRFKNSGECTFTLEQIMRESPLKYVMNAGIRVEKVNR
ncbi:gliding motility lipoprotein GldH [Agriterribacter humi]|uniref:gliding motility lipoprotein GldH n=1 Tax=Agriterribacter humi TaxID=1104781 RepID=UPI00186B0778|nr:gliding motility lipoprotein GldH [Agriterribacter humi]